MSDSDIDEARNEVQLALSLLIKALDTPLEGATDDEMAIVRARRATRFQEAANKLSNRVLGRRVR